MPAHTAMTISIIAGVVCVLLVLGVAAWVFIRRAVTPPIEVERASAGIELDARRGALHDLSIIINDRPAVMIETLPAGSTVLPWTTFGLDDPTGQNLEQVSIVGRTGNRYFQTTISFGRNETPPSEYASQTWKYVNRSNASSPAAAPPG